MPGSSSSEALCGRIVAGTREHVGESRFDRYFGCTRLHLVQGRLSIAAPNEMYAKWLIGKFGDCLLDVARRETGDASITVEWTVDQAVSPQTAPALPANIAEPARAEAPRRATAASRGRSEQSSRYTLEGFVVGEGNRLAFAMTSRLADLSAAPPAKMLFLHGHCGVGKTHLLSALAAEARKGPSRPRVRYLTGEDFTNEYIGAVRGGRIEEFRASFRKLDLLCIDDVHFIAGKTGTQQEFLHTFDALDMSGARVALASDASPREIENLHERLVSRCLSGMVVEVKEPDEATRRAIVQQLALARGLMLDDAAIDLLVKECHGSVRDIEGIITRLAALAALVPTACDAGGRVTPQLIRRALGQSGSNAPIRRPVRVSVIADIVCRTLGVDLEDIRRRKRHRRIVLARSLVAYLSRQLTTQSYPEIAAALGCGSHSTMIEGCERMRLMVESGETCDGEIVGSTMSARDLCDRLKRLVLNTSPPLAGL